MKLPFFGAALDERFLAHRLRATSLGGIAASLVSVGLFEWHLLVDHAWRWELLAAPLAMIAVKWTSMGWYRLRD